jgi:antirestriction protein ArdC
MKYIDPRWLTFVNAKNKGYSIKKNEHGTPIEFFQRISVNSDNKEKEEVDVDVNKTINRMIIKTYTVFNYTQLNGYGDTIPAYEPTEYKWSSDEKLDSMIDKINITMQYGSIYDGGSYSIGKDLISVPNKEMFKSSDDYYATLFHEIIHWTGHKSRLDRNFESLNNKDYAFEELVAELGSLYLKEKIGLKNSSKTINNSSSYIKSWIKLLNNEKNSLFIALKKADEAVEYIMNIIERGNEKCA